MKKILLTILLFIVILVMPSPAVADLSTGLVLYYSMNKRDLISSTLLIDRSGNGRTATLNGTAAIGSGKIQQGTTFTGVDGNGLSFAGLATGTTFTYSAWIYTSATAINYSNIFAQAQFVGFWYRPGLKRVSYYYGADHQNNTDMALNQWHHIIITSDTGTGTFYIDGVADGTFLLAPGFTADGIGCDSGTGAECLNGKLDDLRLYNRVLSSSEINQLYRQGLGRLR